MTARPCRDCRWCQWSEAKPELFSDCLHPSSAWRVRVSLVTGQEVGVGRARACMVVRGEPGEEFCGPDGRFWEARP